MNDLNKKMARGAAWMFALRFCVRGLSLVSTVILARLLVPADFGLVAMGTSVIAFLELATAFSFDIPLIQKRNASREHFNTAWTLNLLFYAGLTAVLLLVAEPAAAFYQEERLTLVLYALAGAFIVKGLDNIGFVEFRKQLRFKQDFLLLFSRKLIGFLVTVPLAFYFRSYWALVAGAAATNVAGVLLSYVLHPFRPRFSLAVAGEMLNFSKWLVLNNTMNFFRNRSPDFIIGRINGSSELGLFTLAYEISTLPTTELVAPINRAVFPGYSALSADKTLLARSYLDVISVIALVALPMGLGVSGIAVPLVDLVLGNKWANAAPIIGILAVFGAVNALQANNGSVYNAIGKPYIITYLGLLSTSILVLSSIALSLRHGPVGVAMAYLGTSACFAPISFYMVGRQVGLRIRDFAAALWRPLTASLLMYSGLRYAAEDIVPEGASSLIALAMLVPLSVVLYAVASLALWLLVGRPRTVEVRLVATGLAVLRARFPQAFPLTGPR